MKKLLGCLLCVILLFCLSTPAAAIPALGVAPGTPGDPGLADAFYDGFPISLNGSQLTVWYGANDGEPAFDSGVNDIWLLTTSAAGASFTFAGQSFSAAPLNQFSVASYKPDVYGINLTAIEPFNGWSSLDQKFYSYEFDEGGKKFYYLNGYLDNTGMAAGDWMYAVLEGNSIDAFSPRTTSSVPEPTTMLLFGSGILFVGLFGRKQFKQ